VEQVFGRPKFDAFLKDYFDQFAFQSITTAQSLDYMRAHLFTGDPKVPMDPQVALAAARIPVNEWVFKPGLPASAPTVRSEAFAAVDGKVTAWMQGHAIDTANWSAQEWQHFLQGLPERLNTAQMRRLDKEFHLTDSGNSEILSQWLLMAVRNHYAPANERLEAFLTTVGRRKYVKPLYAAMDLKQANAIYDRARPMYHPITQATIDALLAARNGQ
jgi:hypothetical protein